MATNSNVNPSFVREIISTSENDDVIEGAIATADVVIRHKLKDTVVEKDLAAEIKRWLAAHFVALKDPATRISDEKIGEASVKYTKIAAGDNLGGLDSTRWGRVALALDPTGALEGSNGRRVRLVAI